MAVLNSEIRRFFDKHNFVIVGTIGPDGVPHASCKSIMQMDEKGEVILVDLYKGRTSGNLKENPFISITAVDEHRFKGYCLKGSAEIVRGDGLDSGIFEAFRETMARRIAGRVIKNVRGEAGHRCHPEARMPAPEHAIVATIREVVDLAPVDGVCSWKRGETVS